MKKLANTYEIDSSLCLLNDNWYVKGNESAPIRQYIRKTVNKNSETFIFENMSNVPIRLVYKHCILIKKYKALHTYFKGSYTGNGGATLLINEHVVPFGGIAAMVIAPPISLTIELLINAGSSVKAEKMFLEATDVLEDLSEKLDRNADILIITPDYPSSANLYLCGFVHSRCRVYAEQGLKIQVMAARPTWYSFIYEMDGVSVFVGSHVELKKLLSRRQYKVIVTHFVDENLYSVFDGHIRSEQLIFICHGPETSYRGLPNKVRQYFTKPIEHPEINHSFDIKDSFVKRYADKENVEWVFVSQFLKDFSEQLLGINFKKARIISNIINDKIFPYSAKVADDRKKIVVIRKFDDISVHSIDQVVFAILELSRRSFFHELSFEIHGDGSRYDELTAPLRQFNNITFYRAFIPNDKMKDVFARHGILIIPSRHDSQGVVMCEAAFSGVVAVGSDLAATRLYMNNAVNKTLTDPENPIALADIIERLYNNPEEFLAISNRMAAETRLLLSKEKTIDREIALIKEKRSTKQKNTIPRKPDDSQSIAPLLSIVVPAYNVEEYLEKCLFSLVNHANALKIEILIIDDGSKDETSHIAQRYEKLTNGIVRYIHKENGGHGSTINLGIKEAKGKYFRLIDGDDWVDSENLSLFIAELEKETSDILITLGKYDYAEKVLFEQIIEYPMLREGSVYNINDLTYPGYGFVTYGPLLTTGTYRLECLRKANFTISEKKPYVDMEFNAFAIRYAETLKYVGLDIYRYLIGREGQTISKIFWEKKYRDHAYIIINILKTVTGWDDMNTAKLRYIYEHITAPLIDTQVFMYDQVCQWKELDAFLLELSPYSQAYKAAMEYIYRKNDASKIILNEYKKVSPMRQYPITGESATVKKRLFKRVVARLMPTAVRFAPRIVGYLKRNYHSVLEYMFKVYRSS